MQWQDPLFFAILLASFIGFLFLLMLLIVWQGKRYIKKVKQEEANKIQLLKEHQLQLANAAIASMEKERKRIAADLHDGLIGNLRRILLMNKDVGLKEEIKLSIGLARNISHDLIPPLLEQLPMEELINYLIEPLKETYAVSFTKESTSQLNPEIKLHLFRILQELINNILKHSQANSISIYFTNTAQKLFLSVIDNGIGFQNKKRGGIGLQNIEMRCQLIQSNYQFINHIPQGTKFELQRTIS